MLAQTTKSNPAEPNNKKPLLGRASLQHVGYLIIGVVCLFLVVSITITLTINTHHTKRQTAEQYRLAAMDHLASELSTSLRTGNVAAIESLLMKGVALNLYDHAVVSDMQGSALPLSSSLSSTNNNTATQHPTQTKTNKTLNAGDSEQIATPIMGSDNKPIAILNASRQVATIQHSWFDTIGQAAMLSLPFSVLLGVGLLWVLRRLTLDIRQTRDYADNILSEPGKQGRINTPIRELADLKSALLNLSKGTARQYDLLVSEGAIRASALAACQEGLLVLDESFQIIEANGAAEEVLNTPRSDMLFRPICDFMCDQWLQTSSLPADQTPMRICVVQDPTSGRCDDWIEIAMASFFAQSSRFWLCTVNDLSEEIAAERKNQRLSKELDQLNVELAVRQRALDEHAMVFTCDAQGVVLSGNQTLTDITGCPLSDLVGRTFVFTRDLEHDICLNGEIYETLSAGNTWQGDTICWNITGKMFWVAFTIVPLPTEGGKSDGFLVVGTDISAQKSLEFDLHEARLEQARTSRDIQTTLLVTEIPATVGFADIRSFLLPAENVAGDFIAFSRISDTCFEILVGDVMGSGVTAALVAASTKSSYYKALFQPISETTVAGQAPSLEAIVNTIHARMSKRLIELEMFVTLALYRFDMQTSTLTYINAGHTPGIIGRADGSGIEELTGENVPIGFLVQENYRHKSTTLHPRDVVCLFSDGISEATFARTDEQIGIERIEDHVRLGMSHDLPLNCVYQSLILGVHHSTELDTPDDDQSLTMIEFKGENTAIIQDGPRLDSEVVLELAWTYEALDEVREFLTHVPMPADEPTRQALLLACFETCTNIVRHVTPYHSTPTYTFRFRASSTQLIVDIFYAGPSFDQRSAPTPDFSGETDHGFGLFIIQELVDEYTASCPIPYISQVRLVQQIETVVIADHGLTTSSDNAGLQLTDNITTTSTVRLPTPFE